MRKRPSHPNTVLFLGVADDPAPFSIWSGCRAGRCETSTSGSTQKRIGCILYVTPILHMTWF